MILSGGFSGANIGVEFGIGKHVQFRGNAKKERLLQGIGPGVSVRVDQTGQKGVAAGVDFADAGGDLQMRANGFDAAAFDPNVGAGEDALAVKDTRAADDEGVGGGSGSGGSGFLLRVKRRRDGGNEGQSGSEGEDRGEWKQLVRESHVEEAPFLARCLVSTKERR